jgi:hypothetical protein
MHSTRKRPYWLPPDDQAVPSAIQRIWFYISAVFPWVVLYAFTASLHLRGTPFRFEFEKRLPIYPWTAVFYQSIYATVIAAPWLARTHRDLRRLTISVGLALAIVFPIYWLVPSEAPRRALVPEGAIAQALNWERDMFPPTAAFPSFHVLWVIFVARLIRPLWLGIAYAACVTVSCITTGMHYIPDVLVSVAIAPALIHAETLYKRVRVGR